MRDPYSFETAMSSLSLAIGVLKKAYMSDAQRYRVVSLAGELNELLKGEAK